MSDRSKAFWKRVITGVGVIAALVLSVLSTLFWLPHDWRLLNSSETTVGVVVSDPTSRPCGTGNDLCWMADLTYTTEDGTPQTGNFLVKGSGQSFLVQQGTKLEVHYMRDDPADATTFAASSIRRDVIIEFLLGPALFVAVVFLGSREVLRWQRRRQAEPPPLIR